MKKMIFTKVLLAVAGITGLGIGASLVFNPVAFEASSGIILDHDPGLLSEIRGMGGPILLGGLFLLAGIFVRQLQFSALVLLCVMYLGYGFARIISLAADGTPSAVILTALVAELVIGLLGVLIMVKHIKTNKLWQTF